MNEQDYKKMMERIEIPSEMKNRILMKCLQKNRKKEQRSIAFHFKRRLSVVVAAGMLFLGIPVFAGGMITSWNGGSSSIPDYKSLPTAEQCIEDAGYTPSLIERFDNGYVFDEGNLVTNSLNDDTGHSVEKFKSFSFDYSKEGDRVIFSQSQYNSFMETTGEVLATINGIDLYYNGYTNKVVPPDYQLTPEDQIAQENGDLVFSWGSDEVSIQEVQGISWSIGKMHYSLTQIDGKLSSSDLVAMATQVIHKTE